MTTKEDRDKYRQAYKAWVSMKSRCRNPKEQRYKAYGGRGISVCDEWCSSFYSFLSDVGDVPDKVTRWSLERLDVDGNYEPGNVKWETYASQARNRRMQSRNVTGKTGVCRISKGKYEYYVAFWSENDGSKMEKTFSILKLGEDVAFESATEYRNKMIQLRNSEGANYSDKHGE